MKSTLFLILLLFLSCEQNVKKSPNFTKKSTEIEISKPIIKKEKLHPWFLYYQKQNIQFKPDSFELQEISPIQYQKTEVAILNEKGFNEVYKPFLVFNESKTKYLDFDSYQWFPNPDGSVSFEADQQVVLINYAKKEARQIAFFGPSYWIEDAIWKGDSVAILMGNSYEKVPFIYEYNFPKNTFKYFKYPDTLKFEVPYSEFRQKSKGIKIN